MITTDHAAAIAKALADLLPNPSLADVAFLRCLPSELIDAIIDAPDFGVPGWRVLAVVDRPGPRRITADAAVERRENKAEPTLLLIDPIRAGAGLDGIYSSAREVGEEDLFDSAEKFARRKAGRPPPGFTDFLRRAQRRSQRLGRRRLLTPWQIFDFTIAAMTISPGAALSRLGLWPLQGDEVPDDVQLELSAKMSERLLFAFDQKNVSERVRALLLDDPSGQASAALDAFLRDSVKRSPLEAAIELEQRSDLWLGALRPRFATDSLVAVKLTPWRGPAGKLLKWSGLTGLEDADGKPRLVLDRNAAPKDQGRLEVRWTTEPDGLKQGAAEYRVALRAGEEELAAQTITHAERPAQRAVFTLEDFDELEPDAKFEALVAISVLGVDGVDEVLSEEFVLEFGQAGVKASSTSGKIVRTLAEGAIVIANREQFDDVIHAGHLPPRATEDRKGYVNWRAERGGSVRVFRPPLIRQVEDDWRERNGPVGRWTVRVRADGTPAGGVEFTALSLSAVEPSAADRIVETSRKLAQDLGELGFLARPSIAGWKAAETYVNAWEKAIDAGDAALALHGTIEVLSLSGRTIGLIVTPIHPARVAWQAAYDHIVAHARYEQNLTKDVVQKTLAVLDSAFYPFALPGVGDRPFVFADTLGLHAVAMTRDDDPEPKASIAILASCLGGGQTSLAPSIGAGTATILAREIRHYLSCRRKRTAAEESGLSLLNLRAFRSGDGMTIARALGDVVEGEQQRGADQDENAEARLCFTLDLHQTTSANERSGAFLANVGRRRRSGAGQIDLRDRWMAETARRPGEIIVPRLRWARRTADAALEPSHLSLAFDVFEARLEARPIATLVDTRPIHGFGLAKCLERHVRLEGEPQWSVYAPPKLEGERAPENRAGVDRLLRIDAAINRATVRYLGGGETEWPVIVTRLAQENQNWIQNMHDSSDWVVTIDRNACIEFFDAPLGLPDVYERFVIDAVPERSDLGALQLVTSTSHLDEVRDLVDEALGDMGLSSSERNSRFLLARLKALSGRLAIRLANHAGRTGEMIALALMQAQCEHAQGPSAEWLDLDQGFFVPVDEIIDVVPTAAPQSAEEAVDAGHWADFVHVSASGARGPLSFHFVEVKHRLHLKTARQPDLLETIVAQTQALRERWFGHFFGVGLAPVQAVLRRSQLARILRFYCDRAARHRLTPEARTRLMREIDQLLLNQDYEPGTPEHPDVGYVFCPEYRMDRAERLYAPHGDETQIWLFGPTLLPEEGDSINEFPVPIPSLFPLVAKDVAPEPRAEAPNSPLSMPTNRVPSDALPASGPRNLTSEPVPPVAAIHAISQDESERRREAVDVVLGQSLGGGENIVWRVSIKSNPHLMLVGLPGMGKTTALINICRQLAASGIVPIVFSYHDDIDEKLGEALGELNFVDYAGLGYNPLRVDANATTAYIDVTGTLRDIFGSIFGDLGDLQLEELRQAIKQSYDDLGWKDGAQTRTTPTFNAFFEILKSKPKPNPGLLARLSELADYGFFDGASERTSLLSETRPTIVRVHGTTNGILQRAFSSFVLYSLYKDMFRRGVQSRITHAVVFDEAHRAAKLKLIPQFAKECRKFGIAFALASQEAKDFDRSLYSAVGSYLILRVTEADARVLARTTGSTLDERRIADRLKTLANYTALFFTEGRGRHATVRLST